MAGATMVPIHTFKAYRLRSPGEPETPDRITAEDLAAMLTEMSGQATLGPIINVLRPADPAVIVGQLQGYVGIAIDANIAAPVGVNLPPPPGARGGNRR